MVIAEFSFNFSFFPIASEAANATDMIWVPGASGLEFTSSWAAAFGVLYPEADLTMTNIGSAATQQALVGQINCFQNPIEAICSRNSIEETLWGFGDLSLYEGHIINDGQRTLQEQSIQQLPAAASAVATVYSQDVTGGSDQRL